MKSIFGDLDSIIEQAVGKATETEKSLQKKQTKSIKKHGLEAEKESKDVDEAEDDDKSKDDESIPKLKGQPGDKKSPEKNGNSSEEIPGTKTSKKLDDPSTRTVKHPKFDDVKSKINALRGSSSLSDDGVQSSVKSYLDRLSSAEKSALLTYLTNLAQIMSTVKSPDQVKDPSNIGIKTSFKSKQDASKHKTSSQKSPVDNDQDKVIVVGDKS